MKVIEEMPDRPLRPWECLMVSIDLAHSDGDCDCMVVAVYDALRRKLIIVDVETGT